MNPLVDFFIVGAPKCGTTALAQLLSQHPDIVISSPKEPHYFSSDLGTGGYMPTSDADYHSYFFPHNKAEQEIWGEASVWNMYSDIALKRISAYNPKAKIIVLIRDPAKAAFSLHQQMIYQGHEDEKDFLKAWEQSDMRFRRETFPISMDKDPKLVAYKHAFDFIPQLQRIYKHFPDEAVKIIKQDVFLSHKTATLDNISAFIGASPWNFNVKTVNKSLYIKTPLLAELLRSRTAQDAAHMLRKLLGVNTLGIGRPSTRIKPEYIQRVHQDMAESLESLRDEFSIDFIKAPDERGEL